MDREFIVDYSVGVMLESPRACLRADSIVTPVIHAQSARKRSSAVDVAADQPLAAASTEGPTLPGIRFCSVGTNDLTALVYGFSRDDCGQVCGLLYRGDRSILVEKFLLCFDVDIDSFCENTLIRESLQTIRSRLWTKEVNHSTGIIATLSKQGVAGVGTMIQLAIQKIRKTNPNVKVRVVNCVWYLYYDIQDNFVGIYRLGSVASTEATLIASNSLRNWIWTTCLAALSEFQLLRSLVLKVTQLSIFTVPLCKLMNVTFLCSSHRECLK